jgi:hypothetical protein
VPHEIVRDELSTPLERVEKRRRPVRANQSDGGVHLYHRQPSASGRDGVAFARVSLLSDPQCVQSRLKLHTNDDFGCSQFTFHEVCHPYLRLRLQPLPSGDEVVALL